MQEMMQASGALRIFAFSALRPICNAEAARDTERDAEKFKLWRQQKIRQDYRIFMMDSSAVPTMKTG